MPTTIFKAPPASARLSQSSRSSSKCEGCVCVLDCDESPSNCGKFVPPIGHFGSIFFDTELPRVTGKRQGR
jgi:hypothetical protein